MIAYERSLTANVVKPLDLGVENFWRSDSQESLRYMFARVFSCWHREMGRPITHEGKTYRACCRCGMRRDFDLNTWRTRGRFYAALPEK